MRKTKTFKIEGRDPNYTVKELTVREIISLMEGDALDDMSIDGLKKLLVGRLLPLCTEGFTVEDLMDFAPSELEVVWSNFQEVNTSFFVVARKSGLTETLSKMKEAFLKDFSGVVVSSLSQGTPPA